MGVGEMSFIKYTDIENSYRQKYINDFFDRHPDMHEARYGIQEKSDGSNVSFIFTKTQDASISFTYAKRSGIIAPSENFYDIHNYVKSIMPFIENVIATLDEHKLFDTCDVFTMFGEYFGPGIQKRINYGAEERIMFFDIAKDGKFVSMSEFYDLMKMFDSQQTYTIPLLHIAQSFDEAMKFDTHFNSRLGPVSDELANECEGIVIKPFDAAALELRDQYGHCENFFIKIKNEKFAEKMKVKIKKVKQQNAALTHAQAVFEAYITDNRIQGIFSKEGMIESPKDIGRYIKLIVDDAKKDFMQDDYDVFMHHEISDKERGKIFSTAGKIIVKKLMEYV
jgi:Rnl2 family RNA ligase